MKELFATILLVLCLHHSAFGQTETCHLNTYVGSWMKTGTPFSVECPSGTYTGTVVSQPARRFFHRGKMTLKFDTPHVNVEGTAKNPEGVFRPGRKTQISEMFLAGGAGIGSKDLLDGLSNAVFKSWYMIPVTFGIVAVFEKGGDITLERGAPITVERK